MTIKKDAILRTCRFSVWGALIGMVILLCALVCIVINMILDDVPGIIILIWIIPIILFLCIAMAEEKKAIYNIVYKIDRDEDKFIFHTYRELYIIEADEVSFDKKKFKWTVSYENKKLFVYNKIPRSWATECFTQEEIKMLIRG